MAYNLAERFPKSTKYYHFSDPGAYQYEQKCTASNKYPFLSNTPRNTQVGKKLWTHALYHTDLSRKIPNCTSLMSKQPRFSYEALFKIEDDDILLCDCDLQNSCECSDEEANEKIVEVTCQGKVRKILYKGHPPRSSMGEGLSVPSKNDNGFSISPDNSIKRIKKVIKHSSVFYDPRVSHSSDYYHGWKWSKWNSKRPVNILESTPGPADYNLVKNQNDYEKCADILRSYRRKKSKQLRFIEMVQSRNIREDLPGPGYYSPKRLKGTNLKFLGPKAARFSSSENRLPGPSDYWLKRDFDINEIPSTLCLAKLPTPACFGTKTLRFKSRPTEGPSPCSYCPKYKSCKLIHCNKAAFGSSVLRFKDIKIEDNDVETLIAVDEPQETFLDEKSPWSSPTWGFKSKTIRMKPLIKQLNEPSPADLPQSKIKIDRSKELQYVCPFFSSQGRLQCWFNWLPVHGKLNTPGPGSYNLEKPKCAPVVKYGPLYKSARFYKPTIRTPAPNEYEVNYRNIENILETNNEKLKNNIKNKHDFTWKPIAKRPRLTFEERESQLLQKSIALLDTRGHNENKFHNISYFTETADKSTVHNQRNKTKLLRCFL